jgi:hypothetical protein
MDFLLRKKKNSWSRLIFYGECLAYIYIGCSNNILQMKLYVLSNLLFTGIVAALKPVEISYGSVVSTSNYFCDRNE